MKKMKVIKLGAMLLFLFSVLFVHFLLPRIITEIRNPFVEFVRNTNHSEPSSNYSATNQKQITFHSFDGTKLSATITYSTLDSARATIILLHGIRSSKETFQALSQNLASLGYNSVALDLRAHGQSGGTFCTFGVKEKKDVSVLLDILKSTENLSPNFGIWGQSLGGAVALQTLALDNRLKFGIIESAFSDFTTIVNDYFNFHFGFSFPSFTNYLIHRAGKISDFDPNMASPLLSCKNITQPILLIHGNNDKRISINYAKKNFENLNSTQKSFLEIDKATHLNVWRMGGEVYFNQVFDFIRQQD